MKTLNFIYSTENDIEKLIKTGELSPEKEYLVLIHICVHNKCNIMSLVKIILQYLPASKIIGSSTSGVVLGGELMRKTQNSNKTPVDTGAFCQIP